MPIYEYECNQGHRFEEWGAMSDPTTRHCTVCRARAHRVPSVAGWNTGAISRPSDFRDTRRESDYDRKLAGAFSLGKAVQKANRGIKE